MMEERRAKHVPSKRGLLSERGAYTDSALNHLVLDSDSFSRRCEASDVCFYRRLQRDAYVEYERSVYRSELAT